MPQNEIPSSAVSITERFYEAVAMLQSRGEIRGLGTLAKKWDTSRFVLSTTRSKPSTKRLNTEYIYYISRDYKVSLDWLFFGRGEPFK